MRRSLIHISSVVAVVVVIGCGDPGASRDTTAEPSSTTTAVPVTSPASTSPTSPSTTSPSTTSTTSPSTTSTVVAVPTGWASFETMPTEAFPPCCASTWEGKPSPAWTDDPNLMPDGIYHADTVEWSPDDPSTLVVDVRRYDPCGVLSVSSCEQPPDGQTFFEGQLGIAPDPPRRMTIALDESVRVGLMGWDAELVTAQAIGTDLVSLLVEFDRAYAEVLAAPLLAGGDADQIIDGLLEHPAQGFGPPPMDYSRSLRYSYDGAPPLLLQGPFAYTDGGGRVPIDVMSVVRLTAIEFDQGVVSLYFFAAYYP